MNKIRREDQVVVLSGRDKGGRGVVRRVIMDHYGRPEKVIVEGLNTVTHFVRPNPQINEPGGIIRREAALHVSKVAVVDPDSNLPARVKIEVGADGKKRRVFHVSAKRRAAAPATEAPAKDAAAAAAAPAAEAATEESTPAAEGGKENA